MLPQIYIDLDGVLVGFESGAVRLINNYLANYTEGTGKKNRLAQKIIEGLGRNYIEKGELNMKKPPVRALMFSLISSNKTVRYWQELEWEKGGQVLWNFIKKYNPIILTSQVTSDPDCKPGKIEWCQVNLGLSTDKIIVERDKHIYAVKDGRPNILIDDTPKKMNAWKEAGGIGILHESGNPQPTIEYIKTLDNAGI